MTKQTQVSPEKVLPEDVLLTAQDRDQFGIERRDRVSPDDALAAEGTRYISRERRKELNRQVEILYNRVASELNSNPNDVVYALNKLRKAHSIVLEDIRQYEEALYWVAVVKEMLVKRQNIRRWSYTWGVFVLFYALIWLIVFIFGFFLNVNSGLITGNVWFSALAGGIGGCVAVLYDLSWQVSVRQEV